MLGAALLIPLGLRARLTTFSFIALGYQVLFSAFMVTSFFNSGNSALPVLACAMLLVYVGTLAFLILVRRRGLGFSFRVAKWGFTLGAVCIVTLLAMQFSMSPVPLAVIFSLTFALLMSIYILPPVLMAISLWRAEATMKAMRIVEEIAAATQVDQSVGISGLAPAEEKKDSPEEN